MCFSEEVMAEDGTKLVDIGLDLQPERAAEPAPQQDKRVSFNENVNVRYIPEEEFEESASGTGTEDEEEEGFYSYPAQPSPGGSSRRRASSSSDGILRRPLYTLTLLDAVAVVLAGVLVFNLARIPWLDKFPESVGFLWKVLVFAIVIRVLFYLLEHLVALVGKMTGGGSGKRRRGGRRRRD